MELIKSADSRYDVYETLLLERDQVRKEAGQIWTAYLKAFGQLVTQVYEEKVECVKRKKAITFCQQAINHGGTVDADKLRGYLDAEMANYYANLKSMQQDYETSKASGMSTEYEVQRSKTLYRRLAKLLHPDINPATAKEEKLMELWNRAVTAYGHNDVKELAELEVLVGNALKELQIGEITVDIPDIEEKIEALKEEIEEIKQTEPYTYKELVGSEEKSRNKTLELENELETYRQYHTELDRVLQGMIDGGRVHIQWPMN